MGRLASIEGSWLDCGLVTGLALNRHDRTFSQISAGWRVRFSVGESHGGSSVCAEQIDCHPLSSALLETHSKSRARGV